MVISSDERDRTPLFVVVACRLPGSLDGSLTSVNTCADPRTIFLLHRKRALGRRASSARLTAAHACRVAGARFPGGGLMDINTRAAREPRVIFVV
jgi:hypothetical protein